MSHTSPAACKGGAEALYGAQRSGRVQLCATTCNHPPRRRRPSAAQVVRIRLAGGEASDYLNFVLKDETARIWWGRGGAGRGRGVLPCFRV